MLLKEYTKKDIFNLYKKIPLGLDNKEYKNIINNLYNYIQQNNNKGIINNGNFLKSKIIEYIVEYKYNFNDNTTFNKYNIDIINKNLKILIEIKVNTQLYGGKNGKHYNELFNNNEYLAPFKEDKIYYYLNIIKQNYCAFDLYICIYSEMEDKLYFIDFFKLYNLFLNKKFICFLTNSGYDSSLFFNKKYFFDENDFTNIINNKYKLKEYINNNLNKISNFELFIKIKLCQFTFFGIKVIDMPITNNNIFYCPLKFFDNLINLTISKYYRSDIKGIYIIFNSNKFYLNGKQVTMSYIIKYIKNII